MSEKQKVADKQKVTAPIGREPTEGNRAEPRDPDLWRATASRADH